MSTITAAPRAEEPSISEAPLHLTTEAPRSLTFSDQAAFWANLGVSLIGFSSAAVVLPRPASLRSRSRPRCWRSPWAPSSAWS